MGIRAEESARRANRGRISEFSPNVQYKPIFHWQEWHVWAFIEEYALPYPCLYDEGFDRIGCVICPFMLHKNQSNVLRHKARWPKYYKVFESVTTDWFLHHSTKKDRYNEETPEEYLTAYYRGFE